MCSFLNNLDDYIPILLNNKTLNIIIKNIINDVNGILLTANEYGILNRIAQLVVKSMFNVDTLHVRPCLYNPMKESDGEYLLSNYHMEFDLTDKALEYIKSVISNRNISQRQFVFIIKNAEPSINRNTYLALRRLIDINKSAKFIITTTTTSFMEKSLLSRLLMLNCHFPFDNIVTCGLLDNYTSSIPVDKLQNIYSNSNFNIVTLLQNLSNNCKLLMWQQSCDTLLEIIKKEKKDINVITSIRERTYKLFHVGVPLKDICKYIIQTNKDNKHITEIIKISAECDHMTCLCNKDLLLYEKFFLDIYNYII